MAAGPEGPAREKIALIRRRLKDAYRLLESCRVCPRRCGVNRLEGGTGFCGMGFHPVVSSDNLHHGEEPPISGTRGSGTLFFAGCSLGCVFCQNYPISHFRHGKRVSLPALAGLMLRLERAGAHNINFVTPTHFAPQIMGALLIAYGRGLGIPLVYNTSGYESPEMLALWDGIIDIYMPDMKYSDPEPASRCSGAPDYPEVNRAAIREMQRQAGTLKTDREGIAVRGLLIRHLVLPGNASGTEGVLRFIAREISRDTYISLMSQYFPAHEAHRIPPLDRQITVPEYEEACRLLEKFGLERGWVQSPP